MTRDLFPLNLALGKYDRTQPLLDGRVQPEGLRLKPVTGSVGDFCIRPVYEEYDAAEMSLSWYLMARARGEPIIALPVFPLRMAVHGYLFCRSDAPYRHPKDLVGKRVGTERYRYTVNLWIRGILEEHYGVLPEDFSWVTLEEEGIGFQVPSGVSIETRPGADMERLLIDGEIDCLFRTQVPEAFKRGDTRIRRLFPDARSEFNNYVRGTGIFPITHTIVMAEALWRREPWIAESLVAAFNDAQRMVENFYYADAKHLMFPGALFILEEERAAFGPDPFAQGLGPNRPVLDAFVRYAHEQGYIPERPALEDLFAKNTLSQEEIGGAKAAAVPREEAAVLAK